MEDEPQLELRVSGEPYFATRLNTTLFTFAGAQAMFNHVFLETEAVDEQTVNGAYVFCDTESYLPLCEFIAQHDFPMVLNRNDVPACDERAWQMAHLQDLNDYIPEEWNGAA